MVLDHSKNDDRMLDSGRSGEGMVQKKSGIGKQETQRDDESGLPHGKR